MIAEIIVSAQKRTENLQDVPASVSVLGEQQWVRLHATQLASNNYARATFFALDMMPYNVERIEVTCCTSMM